MSEQQGSGSQTTSRAPLRPFVRPGGQARPEGRPAGATQAPRPFIPVRSAAAAVPAPEVSAAVAEGQVIAPVEELVALAEPMDEQIAVGPEIPSVEASVSALDDSGYETEANLQAIESGLPAWATPAVGVLSLRDASETLVADELPAAGSAADARDDHSTGDEVPETTTSDDLPWLDTAPSADQAPVAAADERFAVEEPLPCEEAVPAAATTEAPVAVAADSLGLVAAEALERVAASLRAGELPLVPGLAITDDAAALAVVLASLLVREG